MSSLDFIIGSKADLPEKYLEQFFLMLQDNSRARFPVAPYDLDFYRNFWQMPLQPEDDELQLWAFENDVLVGFGFVSWKIKYENLHIASAQIYVLPAKRLKGFGTSILRLLFQALPPHIETLSIGALLHSIGDSFLKKYQEKFSFVEIINAVDLSVFDLKEVQAFASSERERLKQLGYSFVEIGSYDYLAKFDVQNYVRMIEEIWNDMPVEDLSYDKVVITVERYKSLIDRFVQLGNKIIGFVAVESKTNKPIGLTKASINKSQPYLAEQDDTGVVHAHRGNGLGLALKYQLLEKLLADPSITQWFAGNALSNDHMLRINKLLKHKEIGRKVVYEFHRKDWHRI
ncbi:MAG TPA: hypothetical protein VMX55_04575 [candidate division Zixibacteria bacterium]|nr:hypothetical protein [candidate division Zixibacteria bacterium]